jgi:hypothetical protein
MPNQKFPVLAVDLRTIAANDPLWKGLQPDSNKAYVGFRICKSLPYVSGPEMHGRYFGMHPQVLADSYLSLLHQQTNLRHLLKAYGANEDRIVGTVVGVAFPEKRGSKWEIPGSEADAPMIDVVAVLHKKAAGVAKLLGDHQSNRLPQSVSIEAVSKTVLIYNPGDGSFVTIQEAVGKYGDKVVYRDEEKGWQAGKDADGHQLVFLQGGLDGKVDFEGVGYTPNPAEKAAHITEIRAELEDGWRVAAMASMEWEPGMEVQWHPILSSDAGGGEIIEVITEGEHWVSGEKVAADAVHPVLRVKVRGKKLEVLRTAAFVQKKS